MSDKVKLRKSTDKLFPELVKSFDHARVGSNEYWRYYDASDSDSDTRSSYSIASLTFQRDRRSLLFPDITDKHIMTPKSGEKPSSYTLDNSIGLPEISSCVVMTSRRRLKKHKKKPRKKSGRYFPEISTEEVQKEKESVLEAPRSMSSAEEYASPRLTRKKKGESRKKDQVKLPSI